MCARSRGHMERKRPLQTRGAPRRLMRRDGGSCIDQNPAACPDVVLTRQEGFLSCLYCRAGNPHASSTCNSNCHRRSPRRLSDPDFACWRYPKKNHMAIR